MKPIEILALSKALSEKDAKAARAAVEAGEYDVDMTIYIKGKVKVGEDTEKTPTASIPFYETLALALHYAGVTREAALSVIQKAMTDALQEGTTGVGAIASVKDIEEIEKKVKEMTAALPKTPVKGAVKATLMVEQID